MWLAKKGDTLKINQFEGRLYNVDGTVVDPLLYTVVQTPPVLATVVSAFSFSCLDAFDKADNILIGEDTQLPNTIINVGDTYQVAKKIFEPIGTDLFITRDYVELTVNMEDGLYYIGNNEALIISNIFSNIRISFTELNSRYDSLTENVDIEAKNNEAVKSVIADFSFIPNFFRILDLNQIRELVILKMLVFLTVGTEEHDQALIDYKEYKDNVINWIQVNTDNSIDNPEVVGDGGDYFNFSWKWGAD
jgi:hypothetical protein